MGGCGFGFDARRANRYDGVMCITLKKLRWAMTLGMLPHFFEGTPDPRLETGVIHPPFGHTT
jgi:hypothetical protein